MNLRDDLLELERGFWAAAGDGSYYREHMAEDGVMVFPFPGGILDKPQTVEAVEQAGRWSSFDLRDARVTELTPDCAVLVYGASGEREGQPTYHASISSVYVRRGGAWQLAVHQQTPIEG